MRRIIISYKLVALLLVVAFIAQAGYAIMPPEVYREAIEQSPVKVVALVKDVKIVEKTEYYIQKKVEFELLESYGSLQPTKNFYGYCKSDTDSQIVGGTIYYYPEVGDEVFVTLSDYSEKCATGSITSYTSMDKDIAKRLAEKGFDGLSYGMGSVSAK